MIDSYPVKTGRRPWELAARASMSQRWRKLYAFVHKLPLFGRLARRVAAYAVPHGSRVWMLLPAGIAQDLWMNLDARFERDYADGFYEPVIQELLQKKLSAGKSFYDVGGHIGFMSLIAARLVGETGAVYTFEPDPENARRISQQVSRNGLKQVSVLPMAVWSRSGTLRFQLAADRSCHNQGAVCGNGDGASASKTIEVNALSLDEFAQSHRPPTLIKLDVEGGEVEVLRGAEQIFAKARPTLICEVHHRDALQFVESYLAERHYSLRWQTPGPDFPRHLLAEPCR